MPDSGFYAYVGSNAKKIIVFRMSSETGELTKIQEARVHADEVPEDVRGGRFIAMALSPNRRFLYASNRTAPYSIHSFAIDSTNGMLTHLTESPAAESAPFISTDRTGRFLFAAHNPPDRKRRTGYVSVAAISDDGFVLAPHQVIHTPPKTHSILPDPSNRFVFAPACDADVVVRCAFDVATGTLDPDGLAPLYMPPKTGPRHHRYHPNGRFMYMVNEYDGTIYCYRYDPRNGTAFEIQIAHTRPPQMDKEANVRASDLRFTPDGKWLYAGVRGWSSLAIFGVDGTTGRLTPAGHCEVPKEPRGFNIDPFGRYLLDSAFLSNSVISYKINAATGALTKAAEFPMEGPNWIKIIRL
jgi:6-phosphogluconolactonase